ncbi:MAG: cytochrome c1 [Verrucomicrobia bacterium]|nr:cytochrome c1 [Verrucomicrobiota bacterium]
MHETLTWGLRRASLALLVVSAASASAEPPTAGVILGPPASEVTGYDPGERLLGELNCVGCHHAEDAVERRLFSKPGPLLGDAGGRLTPQYLRAFLTDPQREAPGTTMPDLLHDLDPNDQAAAVDTLVHFLVSLGRDQAPVAVSADAFRIRQGRWLYHQVGCVACHGPQEPLTSLHANPGAGPRSVGTPADLQVLQAASVPLSHLAAKTTVTALAKFLLDPLQVRPSGRMPALNLTAGEALDIAMYLLRDQVSAANAANPPRNVRGLSYQYFEHAFAGDAPDFDQLTPKFTGEVETFTLAPRKRDEHIGFRFTGTLTVPSDGRYTFFTESDDGSRLYLADKLVVQNDGHHASTEKRGTLELKAGDYPIVVTYFNQDGPYDLRVFWRGPGIQKQEIPASALSHLGQAMIPLGEEKFTVDPGKAQRGRELFASLGCAACHPLGGERPAVESRLVATPFANLNTDAPDSCLAEHARNGAAQYSLTAAQRAAIRASLANRARLAQRPDAKALVTRMMATLNCFACHARDGVGGPEPGRSDYFTTVGNVDLGDEGRLPPHLTGVGAKLRSDWFRQVLLNQASVRPYMATRMPQYGEANVGFLVAAFAAADGPVPSDSKTDEADAKWGRKLVGTEGLSCIQCHVFAGHKSLGVPAIDLTWMPRRLLQDWFRRYLLDPQSLRPGTRMPTFWPDGKSARRDILGGDTERQINAIWAYLSLSPQAGLPPGLIHGRMELVASNEAVIYRNFIAGVSPRGIGVGYPEKANLAFDADQLRLSLIWQGPFIDAARHRTGRGEGFEPPLGYNVVPLPPGAPFAVLESEATPWPEAVGKAAGYQMRGYQLELEGERRPTFRYTFGRIRIQDFPEAVPGELDAALRRTLTFQADPPPDHLWFRAWAGSSVDAKPDGSYLADGKVKLRFDLAGGPPPRIRREHGRTELLVPVTFSGNAARIVENIVW